MYSDVMTKPQTHQTVPDVTQDVENMLEQITPENKRLFETGAGYHYLAMLAAFSKQIENRNASLESK